MGAVFQLCHFKSKKTQTAPNCLLPRELSTPQKPSSGQQCGEIITSLLGCGLAARGAQQDPFQDRAVSIPLCLSLLYRFE